MDGTSQHGAAAPQPTEALPAVCLRPLTLDDVPALEAADSADDDPFNWAGYSDAGHRAATLTDHRTLREDGGQLAVTDTQGTLLGTVSWRQLRTGPSPHSWCWSIGISLLPAQRGQGYGASAQRSLAAYLLEQTPVPRIEADTDLTNIAEQRALEKAGFRREGVLRQAQWRAGQWHDMVLYAVLRGEL
ncbi:MAG: GNAT family N-acetyltransferase [Chloroflexota bacterium]|nr:GNAT family N-acetyltransferase [Chloroflexota bacterium]